MMVVLVHGNFLGPWSWDDVASGLSARGMRTIVVDLPSGDPAAQPGGDLYADARAVREAMLSADGPYVLCGHSYGGVVITEAAAGAEDVTHLVHLAGAAPDAGDSLADLHVSVDDAEQAGAQQDADGEHEAVRVRDDGMTNSPGTPRWWRCSMTAIRLASNRRLSSYGRATRRSVLNRSRWRPGATFQRPTSAAPRIVCQKDSRQTFEATADIVTLDAGHCPNWSQPGKGSSSSQGSPEGTRVRRFHNR